MQKVLEVQDTPESPLVSGVVGVVHAAPLNDAAEPSALTAMQNEPAQLIAFGFAR